MLLSKIIKIKWNSFTKKWYVNKGYKFTKIGDEFEVEVEDLQYGSGVFVEIKCDSKNCEKIMEVKWCDYLKHIHNNKYYCQKCAYELFGKNKTLKTKLKNSKSFEQWCIENNRQDILSRWDYDLNDKKPEEICWNTHKKYYFKCSKGLHKSELKSINDFTNGHDNTMNCKACNSFAQWGIDNIEKNFLEKYWDYEKNNELGINPWKTSKANNICIWIKCQEKEYHDSYSIQASDFVKGVRCPYCSNQKIHPLDSLGKLLEDRGLLSIWSDKNKKSPYEYAPFSSQKVWWKCPEGKHKDYKRTISGSNNHGFRCPNCQFSQGEKNIEKYLINNNIIYIPQKEFDGLIGLGGGNLSYDFYLPELNLLIEYQGRQHEKYTTGIHHSKKDFEKQLEHDKRKRLYALKNNIRLLEIWYWDFDNIEKILNKKLKINKGDI